MALFKKKRKQEEFKRVNPATYDLEEEEGIEEAEDPLEEEEFYGKPVVKPKVQVKTKVVEVPVFLTQAHKDKMLYECHQMLLRIMKEMEKE